MSASADHPLAGVLRTRDAGAPQLGTGIADKICAAFRPGISSVPTTGAAEVNGVKWRLLIDKALLTPDETDHFLIWLEEEHGPDIVQRARQPPRHLDTPSSVSLAGNYSGVKQEEVLAPPRQQYSATSGLGGPSALFSSVSPGRTRAEPYAGRNDVTAANLILASDMAAMGGMNGQSITTLTFVMLTCRLPPQDKDLGYGTDPTMSKAYSKVKQSGHGTLLIDLLGQSSSAGSANLHSHFLLASETLRGCGEFAAAQRLSEMWAIVQRTLPPVEMQRKYLMEYIRKYAGRGIPILIDKDLVMLVLAVCYGANPLGAKLETLSHESNQLRAELAVIRTEIAQVKKMADDLKAAAGI